MDLNLNQKNFYKNRAEVTIGISLALCVVLFFGDNMFRGIMYFIRGW